MWGRVGYCVEPWQVWGIAALVFTGTYEHTIDSKNRTAVPAEIRTAMRKASRSRSGPIVVYVTLGEGQSLHVYTARGFEQRAAELIDSQTEPEQLLVYERLWFSLARRVEIDTAGRIRLPESLMQRAKISREVVLLGVNDHMEIRDRAVWQQYVEQILTEQPQVLMNPRRAISRHRPAKND